MRQNINNTLSCQLLQSVMSTILYNRDARAWFVKPRFLSCYIHSITGIRFSISNYLSVIFVCEFEREPIDWQFYMTLTDFQCQNLFMKVFPNLGFEEKRKIKHCCIVSKKINQHNQVRFLFNYDWWPSDSWKSWIHRPWTSCPDGSYWPRSMQISILHCLDSYTSINVSILQLFIQFTSYLITCIVIYKCRVVSA